MWRYDGNMQKLHVCVIYNGDLKKKKHTILRIGDLHIEAK